MAELVAETGMTGNLLHDAHIAVPCLEHGVRELATGAWTTMPPPETGL